MQLDLQVLAPDPGTYKDGKELARPNNWKDLGRAGTLLWGQTQSKRIKFFKTLFDWKQALFYCSCPDRKAPCRHVLGLALLYAEDPEHFGKHRDLPDWASALQERLRKKGAVSIDPEQAQRNAEARSQSRQKRIELMQAGMKELERWLLDLVQEGLAQSREQPAAYWESMAALFVDYQLPSIGRAIRQFPSLFQQPEWQGQLLRELAWLFSLARAFLHLDQLSESLQEELLQLGGVNIQKKQLEPLDGLKDHWLVLSVRERTEENLRVRHTWLYALQARQFGLLLEFAWGREDFEQFWRTGQTFEGEAVYYPGVAAIRVHLKSFRMTGVAELQLNGLENLQDLVRIYGQLLSEHPWVRDYPFFLTGIIPQPRKSSWVLVDEARRSVPLNVSEPNAWRMLAYSGGHPISLFGLWDGGQFRAEALLTERGILALT